MFTINENYLKLPGSYLFSDIAKKIAAYQKENPEKEIIRLGIGDVTQPLAPAIIEALHGAVEEMAHAETFHGYAPDKGYAFLREAIAKMIIRIAAVTLIQKKSSYLTERNVTPEIFRRSWDWIIRLLCAIRFTPYM